MRTIAVAAPFAVYSDTTATCPGLEAILADLDARDRRRCGLGDLVGYGPFPDEVAALVRDRGIPTLMGNYDQGIGFKYRRLRLRVQDRRAAGGGRGVARLDRRVPPTRPAPTCARWKTGSCSTRRPGSCWPCTAARAASTSTCTRTGRSGRWRGWPRRTRTAPSSSATCTCRTPAKCPRRHGRHHALRQRRQRGPAQGRGLARVLRCSSTRPGSRPAGRPSSSSASPTTTSAFRRAPSATDLITTFGAPVDR